MMTTEKSKRKMLFLHDYETGNEIWIDPEAILCVQLLAAVSLPESGREIPERTKVTLAHSTLVVKQHPGQIAGSANWAIAGSSPGDDIAAAIKEQGGDP